MKNLKLEKPVAFIDLETTGLSLSVDRIVELSVLKIYPDGTEETRSVRVNPEMPIPASATRIHGITNEDVLGKPKFRQYAAGIRAFLGDCDIGGFGVKRFDLPFLEAEFDRVGIEFSRQGRHILDALEVYHRSDPRDLSAAYKKYCDKQLENRHASMADVRAAVEILDRQLEVHPEVPKDVAGLHGFCNPEEANWLDNDGKLVWQEDEATINFGRYKGRSLREIVLIDAEYLRWVVAADFPSQLKEVISRALSGEFPKPC